MSKAKYQTPEHRAERKRWKPLVDRGEAYCVEPRCLVELATGSRWIKPGSRWHVSHTPDGATYLGPSHERCNTSEGAARGNRERGPNAQDRWVF